MIWQGKVVSLSNYEDVFKGYSKDTLEVIRGALFDSTPIESYLSRFKNNPYMLWQVKLAIDEGVDSEWFSICSSGVSLERVRSIVKRGINLKALKELLKGTKLSDNYLSYVFKWYENGICLDRYDFSILPENLLDVFDQGISLGYPMEIFNNGVQFDKAYIIACLKIISSGKKVTKFLDGDWDLANMLLLSQYSRSKYYDKFIDYINKSITPSVLEEIFLCCKVGMPLAEVSSLDSDGVYVYSGPNISIARETFLKKLDYTKVLVPGISVSEASSILSDMEIKYGKKVSGRFRKSVHIDS